MRKSFLILTLILLVALSAAPVAAQDTGPTLDIRAGFDGYYKLNGWLPVQVIAANEGADIEGEIQIRTEGNWTEQVVYSQPAVLPTHSRKQLTFYVFIQNYAKELTVRLVQKDKTVVEQKVQIESLDAQEFLVGVVSDDTAALNYLAGLPPIGSGRVHIAHLTLTDLPAQGRAMGSLDVLIVHNADTAPLTDAQRDALRGWIAFGGHLIICGGPTAARTAGLSSGTVGLGDLLPVRILGTQTTAEFNLLGDWANVPLTSDQPAVVAQVEVVAGNAEVLAGNPNLPLLVRRAIDRGRIDYLALDPDLEPMRTWIGNDSFWPRLFFSAPLAARAGNATINWPSFSQALANIPSLDIPSVLVIAAFLFIYIVVVGPLNLLVLKLFDKQALAWISLPVLILLFSCVAYIFGLVSRGRQVIISEIDIVRAQTGSQVATIDTFVGIYSPIRRQYDVHVPDGRLVQPLVAQAYGGTTMAGDTLKIEQGPPTYVRDLDVNVGAMRGFATHAIQPWQGFEANLTMSDKAGVYHVEGTIANHSGAKLQTATLVLNQQPIDLGDLADGETKNISVDFKALSSGSYAAIVQQLAGPTTIGAKQRERERRNEIANNVIVPQYYSTGTGSLASSLQGLTLLGWQDTAPGKVEIKGVTAKVNQTTLLIIPLPVAASGASQANPDQVLILKGFMPWQVVDGDAGATPHQIYSYQAEATFVFFIPDAQNLTVEKLFIHIDAVDGSSYGQTPEVYMKDVNSGKWEVLSKLPWGQTELALPQRFIRADGGIEVKVANNTIGAGVSIDFSATAVKTADVKNTGVKK